MYRQIFTYPVFVATVLLVLHSWLFRGRRNTLLFWGVGYVIAFAREAAYQNFFPTYRFTGTDLKILNVPVTIPAGWLFEAYISLYMAQFLLGVDLVSATAGEARMTPGRYGRQIIPLAALSSVITGTIAFAIEYVAARMQWWGGGSYVFGHMFTVFWMLTLLLYIMHPALRLRRNLVYVALALVLTAMVESIDSIGTASRTHPWVAVVCIALGLGYLASLLMWRQLLLFFFVIFFFGLMGDVPSRFIAPILGWRDDTARMLWSMCVVLSYGWYLFRTQRPVAPVRPTSLM